MKARAAGLWLTTIVVLSMVLALWSAGVQAGAPVAGPESAPAVATTSSAMPTPEPQATAGIEVEPVLLAQLEADGTTGYMIYFRERSDLSLALKMDWHERGWFVMKTLEGTAERSQARVRTYLDAQGAKYESFWIDNILVVTKSNRATFNGLLAFPEVEALRARRTMHLIEPIERGSEGSLAYTAEPNIAHVGAPNAWALGINGLGSVVASIDTGVRYTHQALVNHYRGTLGGGSYDHNYNWWDPYGDHPTAPADDDGHGTHTMGTTVGDDGGANQIGMAPGAKWMACRGCNTSECADTALLSCAQFMAAPWDLSHANANPDKRPYVVNNSWGDCSQTYDNWYQGVVNSWHAAGIYPVFSNGNSSNCDYSSPPPCNTVGNPARYGNVTGVGSTGQSNGQYASHSNRGPTDNLDTLNPRGYPTIKPQVAAPGVNIRSSVSDSDTAYESGWSGTSMSAPHVTGLIAMMWQAQPCLKGNYARTETIIEQNATPITTGLPTPGCSGEGPGNLPNQSTGWGEINALAAVQAAQYACGPTGTLVGKVTDSSTSAAIPFAAIQASLSPTQTWNTTTNSQGDYGLTLSTGSFTVTAQAYSYFSRQFTGVQVISGTTTTLNIALDPFPRWVVSGTVTDAAAGWPLYAHITIQGDPVNPPPPYNSVWTNPVTGFYSVTLAAGITYTFNVNAWLQDYLPVSRTVGPLTGNRTENFTLNADTVACNAPGYQMDYVYFQDFEANNGGFTTSGTTSWAWGTPTSGPGSAHSGSKLWATNLSGNYNNSENGYLTSPNINLSAYTGKVPVLQWWQWLRSESGYDYASVEVSNDGGATWTLVYGEVSGSVDLAWAKHSVTLDPTYAVNNFRLRFYFRSDSSVTYPGWYVDDIGIGVFAAPPMTVAYTADFEANDGGLTTSGTTSWAWGTPTSGPGSAHSGSKVWATNLSGNYNNSEDGYLTSPNINLSAYTGQVPILQWWQWLQTESCCDYGQVQVSKDGGATWTQLYEGRGDADLAWAKHSVVLDSTYIVSNFRFRFYFHTDGSVTYPGWYVDDVGVSVSIPFTPSVPCILHAGGLVVGNTYDANNAAALAGATVTNDTGKSVTTVATADPAVDDSFYTLFSPAGMHVFTATKSSYGADIQRPTVVQSSTVQQDFHLPAGRLSYAPPALQATLDMGANSVVPLTLTNSGGLTATFELFELDRGLVPLRVSVPARVLRDNPLAKNSPRGKSAREAYEFIINNVRLSAANRNVLILTPDVGSGGGNVDTLLAALAPFTDLTVTVWDPDANGAPSVADLLNYDVVIIGNDILWNNMDKITVGNNLADYIDQGGKVIEGLYIQSYDDWGFAGRYMTGGYSPFSVATLDNWNADTMHVVEPTHPVMNGVATVNDNWGHQDPGLRAGATLLAKWTTSNYNYIAVNNNVVALNQLLHDQADWTGDVGVILHNAVLWLTGAETGVPWLSESPVTGTIPSLAHQVIDVTFNAGVPEVTQPGQYYASLRINQNTPYIVTDVPVTMTVSAPVSWGKLAGVVTGLGHCNAPGLPLDKAKVFIQSGMGMTWTLTTNVSGTYTLWLDQANSLLTLTASHAGYVTQTVTGINVTAGTTVTQDFNLRAIQPCISVTPRTLEASLSLGATQTKTLTLNNTGAGATTFSLTEVSPTLALATFGPGRSDYPPMVANISNVTDLKPKATFGSPAEFNGINGWGTGAAMPGAGRYRAGSVSEDCNRVWVLGGETGATGSSDVMFYDSATNAWTTGGAPIPHAGMNWQAVHIDGKIYLPGGYDGSHNNWLQIYDIASNTWRAGANMPAAITPMAAAMGGKLYIFGGNPGPIANVAMYDPATNTWTTSLAPMPTARAYGRAIAISNYIYVVGGSMGSSGTSGAFERYDPATNTWSTGPSLSTARGDVSLFAVGSYLYASGGIPDYGTWAGVTTVERYYLPSFPAGNWEALPAAPNGFGAAAYGCASNKMWSIGGVDADGNSSTTNRYQDEGLPCICGVGIDIPWLAENPVSGMVGAGSSFPISITFTAFPTMTPGIYTATLVVNTSDLVKPQIMVPVTMTIVNPPHCGFTSSSPDDLGQTTVFTNTTTGDPPLTYRWNFGDGSPISTAMNPNHTYSHVGFYPVVLTAVNPFGTDVCTGTVSIEGVEAGFVSNSPVLLGYPVVFTNTTQANPPVIFWLWDFGDSSFSTAQTPLPRTYASARAYTVTLTAVNPKGSNTYTGTVTIQYRLYLPIIMK